MINITPSEHTIQIERKRLMLSDVVFHTRQETLKKLCDTFHFDNTDLLDIEFNQYLHTKSSFDKAYAVVAALTTSEVESLMPYIQVGQTIVQKCLKIADQKKAQKRRQLQQQRLNNAKRILNPLTYLSQLMPFKTHTYLQKHFHKQSEKQ